MDIKEAFDTVINVLKTECSKHSNCSECVFYADCEDTDMYPHTSLIHLRDSYFNSKKQKDSIRENRELIDNPYSNRVMALQGKVLCMLISSSRIKERTYWRNIGGGP